jgi:hypothetical protein
MSYKYIKPAQRDHLLMVKVEIDGREVWATCSKAVKEYAKKTFKEGDEVEFEYEEKDGKITINGYIKIPGGATPQDNADAGATGTDDTSPEFTCEVCGTALKDGKYKKCYSCNQANPSSSSSKSYSPEVNESIKRQAIGHMTSRALMALQGQVDLNTIHDVTKKLYATFQELVG